MMSQLLSQLPEPRVRRLFLRVFSDAEEARQHADDVAIENRRGLIESDAANRARRVTADSGQCENIIKV